MDAVAPRARSRARRRQIVPPDGPTQEELTQLDRRDARRRSEGSIVLVGRHTIVPVTFTKSPLRRDDDDLQAAVSTRTRRPPQGRPRRTRPRQRQPRRPGALTASGRRTASTRCSSQAGALVRVNDAGRDHGQIRAFNNRTFDVAKVGAHGRAAQRRLRPHRAHPRRRHAGRARVQHRQPRYPGRRDVLQRGRRDPRHRQEGRSGDARRPPRLVALAPPAPPTTRSAAR